MDALLTGERYTAEQARDIGLVTRIASSAETLLQEVAEFATRIAVKPPLATLYVKRAARAALDLDLKKGLDLELDLFAMLAPTSDVKEAAQAFREKREPRFSGR
jgi:enoyl-CoA hydratase/carnithine racemase